MRPLSHDEIRDAAGHLRRGGLVAFPTETVYGLGADAFNEAAVRRVFELKGRPPSNPLIVHVTGRDMARRVVSQWPDAAETLTRELWPGPLTLVLPKAEDLPAIVTAGGPTAAVRAPDHPAALALLFEFGGPLVGPSANPSGRVSPTRAEHVREAFAESDVMVLDGGACPAGIESTVLDLTGQTPRILRRGVIGPHRIAEVLGVDPASIAAAPAHAEGESPLRSPGMLSSHYAPKSPAVLFSAEQWPEVERQAEAARAQGRHIAVLTHERRTLPEPHAVFTLPRDAFSYAAVLYDSMRRADSLVPLVIAIERPPLTDADPADESVWQAVQDRLARATRPL